jgi:REP element-mobilizing transposase RayT
MAAMARTLRIQYPGAVYPVMNRGDRREAIFRAAKDYACFLQTLAEACAKARWPVPAWRLRPNHFHLGLATPQPTLVAGLKWLLGPYPGRFNRRHRQFGHLFSGRYKALLGLAEIFRRRGR